LPDFEHPQASALAEEQPEEVLQELLRFFAN